MSKHTPGPLSAVPLQERLERIIDRMRRGVYTRHCFSYASNGCVLFDWMKMARDLGMSYDTFKQKLYKEKDRDGWKLPVLPTADEIRAAA